MADVDIRVGGFADEKGSVSTVSVGGPSSLSPSGGLRGLNPDLSGHLPGASSSALVVGMPSQEGGGGGGGGVVPSPFRGSYFDSFDESELPKKSANMTERVAVPSSEHVAEIVGRQGE